MEDSFHTPPQTPSRQRQQQQHHDATTWRQAHLETCLTQHTLTVSVQQIVDLGGFDNLSDHPRAGETDVVLWGDQSNQNLMERVLQQYQQQQEQAAAPVATTTTPNDKDKETKKKTKSTSSIFALASQVAGLAMAPINLLTSPLAPAKGDYDDDRIDDKYYASDDDDDEEDVPRPLPEEPDNHNNNNNNPTNSHVVWVDRGEALLNVPLTLECLDYLQTAIQTSPPLILTTSTTNNNNTANSNESSPSSTILLSIHQWVQDVSQDDPDGRAAQLLSHLPPAQVSYLMNLLAAAGHVEKVQHHRSSSSNQQDLIVFPDPTSSTNVRLALWDLTRAHDKVQARIDRLEHESRQAAHNARRLRDAGNRPAALYQLKRHKRLDIEIEQGHAQLQNLEHVKLTLEGAEGTYAMQQTMMETARALKQLREQHGAGHSSSNPEPQPPNASETLEELAQQVDLLEDDQANLMVADVGVADLDEDELTKELETLMMQQQPQEPKEPKSTPVVQPQQSKIKAVATKPQNAKTPSSSAAAAAVDVAVDDDDVDQLLEELDLLQVGSPKTKNKKTTIAATVFGESQTKETEKKSGSSARGIIFGRASRQDKKKSKQEEKEPKTEKPKLTAVCL
mmetsp:Transcript_22611/g.49361  ORF Transcript_22611/g.49361 Transcript_22611/m.49361 type:complete len:621 (-) Transcript_22611:86-1948(-)